MNSNQRINGTVKDVETFFCVSRTTIHEWTTCVPPVLACSKIGRNVTFYEEDVIELKAKNYLAAGRMLKQESLERARREWREHLRLRDFQPRRPSSRPITDEHGLKAA
jgi:hypothetical protein